jgi:hypothetical protein
MNDVAYLDGAWNLGWKPDALSDEVLSRAVCGHPGALVELTATGEA